MHTDGRTIAIAAGAAAAGALGTYALLQAREKAGVGLAATKKSEGDATPILSRLFGPSHIPIVVFLDDPSNTAATCGKNLRFPRQGGWDALVGAVITAFAEGCGGGEPTTACVAGDVRLFMATTKTELGPDNMAELAAAAGTDDSLVVLFATTGGAPLSPEAAARPPLSPVPRGPAPLPFFGNGLLLARGATPADGGVTGMHHLRKNLFTPAGIDQWGPTVLFKLPAAARSAAVDLVGEGVLDDISVATDLIITCDPDVVEELVKREAAFPKMWNRRNQLSLSDFTKNGLFTSSSTSEDWQTGHGLIPRYFGALRMAPMFPPVLDKSRALVSALKAKYPPGTPIEGFNRYLTAMTSDAVLLAALGLDAKSIQRLAADEPMHPLLPAFQVGLTIAGQGPAFAAKVLLPASVRYNPFISKDAAMKAMYADAKKTCEDVINELIEAARSPGAPESLLKALLTQASPANGKLASIPAIHGHMLNLMIAGHETTAATLGFALAYLALHPEWQDKAVAEIDAVLGGRGEPTAADMPKLVTLEAIFKECLRLHPPVGAITRDAVADTTLGNGRWVVRRGQRVMIAVVSLHRREDLWGGDAFGPASDFNPARFMPGAPGAADRPRFAHMPFGVGQRACAGTQFALMEGRCLLCVFLKHFIVRVPPGYKPFSSFRDGGAAATPDNLVLKLFPRPGAPAVVESNGHGADATANGADSHPPAVANGGSPAPAPAPAANGAATVTTPSAPAHHTPLHVLYGSNGGTCETLAGQLVDLAAAAGWAAAQAPLDTAVDKLKEVGAGGPIVVISSTYNGLPPDNASKFVGWVGEGGPAVAAKAADGVKYAVFGVGNRQWEAGGTFLKIGKLLDAGLGAAGGERIRPFAFADADDMGSFAECFDDWVEALLPELAALYGIEGDASGSTAAGDLPVRAVLEAVPPGTPTLTPEAVTKRWREEEVAAAGGKDDPTQGYHALPVVSVTQLQAPSSDRKTALLEVRLPPGLTYTAGGHFELLPRNAPHLVKAALDLLSLDGSEAYAWTPAGTAATHGPARGLASQGRSVSGMVIAARDALEWLVDLGATPSRKAVARLAEACPCPPEAAALRALATEEGYKEGVAGPRLALLDLLARFKSAAAGFDLAAFINAQPRLTPRYYSISSSPSFVEGGATKAGGARLTITVGLVECSTAAGRVHIGPGSGAVHAAKPGDVILGTVRALQSRFRLPTDPATPVIMVGPGTGVAPMIGFLEERAALKRAGRALGPAVLFFRCRNEDYLIFKDRLEAWVKEGVLSTLHVALSRPKDGGPKMYVQDPITKEAASLWPLLEGGAHFYICGDARRMAPDVRRAVEVEVVERVGGRGAGMGAAYVGTMMEQDRFLMDVWAG